VASAG